MKFEESTRIIFWYTLAGSAYSVLCDFIPDHLIGPLSLKGMFFIAGFMVVLNLALRHMKRKFTYRLTYLQAFLTLLSIGISTTIVYRVYCLVRYAGGEIEYLAMNYKDVLLRMLVVSVGLSALTARFYKTKKPKDSTVPKEIKDMFDMEMK